MKTIIYKVKIVAIGLLCIIGLWQLDDMVNHDRSKDPTKVVSVLEKESYYNQGLLEGIELSDRVLYDNDNYIIYADRILLKTDYQKSDHVFLRQALTNLKRQIPKDVNIYIAPIPNRALFEEDTERTQELYQEFYDATENQIQDFATMIDLRDVFKKHMHEYIFYRTEDAITSRGGFYAVQAINQQLGIEESVLLSDYDEYMYTSFKGNLIGRVSIDDRTIIANIPEDKTYYYVLPGTQDMAEIFKKNDEDKTEVYKSPVFIKSGVASGVILYSGQFSHAIIEGDGLADAKADKTLLYIADTSGQELIPFFSNYYDKVYYVHLNWNKDFAAEEEEIQEMFQKYNISDIIYCENAAYFASQDYSVAMRNLYNEKKGQ